MPLTRLDNLLSSKTGKYIYVSPDDFNASDSLDNRGNSQLRPFVSIQRAFLEVARFSYVPGVDNDRFDQFTIMLSPGTHYVDNRPGDADTAEVPIFNYDVASDTWNDNASFDLGDPNNILYRFNGRDGGTTIPRGTSLVGADLRRTQVRALYIPDPADKDVPRTSLFNVTGGCYFWQFTILDGNPENGPLNGKVYTQPGSTQSSIPLFSHHKMTNFVYADKEDLSMLYRKISKCFSKYQTAIDDVYTAESGRIQDTWNSSIAYTSNNSVVFGGEAYKAISGSTNKRPDLEDNFWERLSTISREFDYRIQENRIVGPLADTVQLDELIVSEPSVGLLDVTVRTKINHGYFPGQYVAVANTGLNANLEGVFRVYSISSTNPKEFKYRVVTTANAVGLIPGASITPNASATVQAEIDSVESASPYVFNVSIRSTWGICGIWADGRKATGFKSMVIAQYTGVSLQKDDRAFIRYDEFSNTWNQAPLTDAFATTPYHIKGDAFWKDDWRNFHVKASDDSFIQNVSIFAVGFADHFLLESGGDMSITNSNSNFGNTSMHSKGFKGFAFNQDKGGYITDIVPPQKLDDSTQPIKISYYPIDIQLSKPSTNSSRLYLTGDKANNFLSRPAASINGYRLGARTYITDEKSERLYVNTTADQTSGETGSTLKSAVIYPQGFKIWSSALDTLSPADLGVGDFNEDGLPNTAADTLSFNLRQDSANLIDANKIFIQSEAFGYVLEKYPYLQTIPYVNPNITSETGRYRDARNLILSNRQEIIDYSFTQMLAAFPTFTVPNGDKCKRDLGIVIDAVAADLYDGGNSHIVEATKTYFNEDDSPLANGLLGEETQSVYAFNRAKDWAKKAISNLLGNTSKISLTSLTSSGTTITATSSTAHGLAIGQQISITGSTPEAYNIYKTVVISSGFTPTQFRYVVSVAPATTPATGAFYASTVIIDSQNSIGEARRFKDGAGLVTSNRQEIIDRAAAQIAIDYPDFYYPGDAQTTATSRFKDAYRLIQQNRTAIIDTAYAASGGSIPADTAGVKCKRDIGIFIDAVSLDIAQGGGNKYSRKFIQQYFNAAGTTPITGGLVGEETQSNLAFNSAAVEMKKAITNQLTIKDLTITADSATGSNTNAGSCANVQSAIDSLTTIITARITAGNLTGLPAETNGTVPAGELKCKRDIGIVVDAVQQDLFWGGNEFVVGATKEYFTNNTTLLSNGLSGEITQSVSAFNAARDMAKKAITNQLFTKDFSIIGGVSTYGAGGSIIPNDDPTACADTRSAIDSLFGIITSALTAGNLTSLPATNNGKWDCANVRNSIDTLFSILTTAIRTASVLAIPPSNPGPWSTVSESSKCRRDIGYLIESVTADLRLGGNENTINAAESYFTGTGQQALSGTISSIGVITGLTSTANLLAGMAVTKTSGAGAFGVNARIFTIDSATQITVTQTSGTFTAGAIAFIANQLDYIESERVETLDAYDYVRNLAISAMRNHNTYVTGTATGNSSIITVPSTSGLVVGMSVRSVTTIPLTTGSQNSLATNYNDELEEIVSGRVVPKASNYTTSIPSTAYIMKVGDGTNGLSVNTIKLGAKGSKFDLGTTVNALSSLGTNTPVKFFFQLEQGVWANAIDPSVDLSVTQDYGYSATNGECSSVVENLNTFFTTFSTVINNGIGSVTRKISTLSTGSFAKRATLFTLTDTSAGALPTNPHHLETGTPVRLVPRAKTGATNVNKRLIRLPKGFDTNTTYYVIAAGRKTDPYDYSNTTRFDGTTPGSFQNLMLASSVENAATGIYIYSSETQSIDENVVVDVYQYVLDVKYNLNQYITRRGNGTTLVTEEPHVFDKPNSSWNLNDAQKYQAIFFKPIGSGSLPAGISSAREYYARYVNEQTLVANSQFQVFDTLTAAVAGTTPINFAAFGGSFYTFSSKKRSPLRFAPEAGASLSYDETRLYVNDKTVFAINDYVKVDDEFFFVTGISTTGTDHLVVTRASLGTFPVNHSTGAIVIKWSYLPTAVVTTLTETVDLVETIFDFTSVTNFVVGDYVRFTNNQNALTEVVRITKIEGLQVIATRAQLGTVVQTQTGTVTATKLSLSVATPSVTSTLTEGYPRLLTASESGNYAGGTWYIGTDVSRPNTILERIRREDFSTKDKTPDTWFERLEDTRTKEDRVYRLRYVVPNYLKAVRDPLNGFVIKARTDDTRKLLPQKILVKPTGTGANIAELSIVNLGAAVSSKSPNREYLGYTSTEHGPTFISAYDPYNTSTLSETDLTPKFRKRITTDSKVSFYIQSAKRRNVNGTEYLELTVFDVGIEEQGYKEKLFTTVKIDPPQGGNGRFIASIANLPESNTTNIVTWSGSSKGRARVHAYFEYGNQNYMIIKDITLTSSLEYYPNEETVFTQGSVSATLVAPPDGGRSDINNFLYVIQGANVYTMTPGDTFQAENGNYTIASVEDTEDFSSSFYIFDIDTIRRRIFGQQDGIYYLTCLRGDIQPFPTGSGVGDNFRGYKFSQPVSKLYPEFYKNDPEWYKQLDASLIDPPNTVSAADNYVHGLVTVNDSKSSVTKEGVLDLIQDPGSKRYSFTGSNEIKAKSGLASAGSEARRIPICGDSLFPTEKKYFVELRRPSIARSGNHTFEYLGFGPGNYSTGFPARQEVVLTDIQDFYAQAKRENGGIVFYTGLNSNGDLYIGNRKINAITGEETFLESALLVESGDEDDSIGNFVTTFDGPVTFNDIVSFLAPLNKGANQWTSPIYMDVDTIVPTTGFDAPPALQIKANIADNDDDSLRMNPITQRPTGDIILTDNRLQVAVVDFNTRGLQDYSLRVATGQTTPDQLNTFGAIGTSQIVGFGTKYPLRTGDILLKGEQVGLTGSIAWVYGNNFAAIASNFKLNIQGFGAGNNKIRLNWSPISGTASNYTNAQVGIQSANYQIKITGTFNNSANSGVDKKVLGAWSIIESTFASNNTFVEIQLNTYVDTGTYDISSTGPTPTEPSVVISISNVAWKEVGVIGAESIRTKTDDIGDYRVGINTVARTAHTAYTNGFVESGATDPRANLDIVGTTFISGKTLAISPNNYIANATLGARTFINQDNALLVGGDSATPDNASVFRIATTNSGRVGINTTSATLDRSLVVVGTARITGDFMFESDINVNGGDITTTITSGAFNFLNQSVFVGTFNIANYASTINIGNSATSGQTINAGTSSSNSVINIGNSATTASNISKINIGGAYENNESQSYVSINTKSFRTAGDVLLGASKNLPDTLTIGSTAGTVNFFNTITSALNFGSAVSSLVMGGQGGSTRIRNSLTVNGSITGYSNITLVGGLVGLNFTGDRSQLGSTGTSHTGTLTPPLLNTVDLVSIITTNSNLIDTPANAVWGSTATNADSQQSFVSAGITLPAVTGNYYYLPLKNAPIGTNSISVNDFLIINSAPSAGRYPEIVQVDELSQISGSGPYWIKVKRTPLGSFLPKPSNGHLDDTVIYKAVIQFNSTWITTTINSSVASISIAEIGGTINAGDYIIVDRISTDANDVNGSESGEAIKILSSSALISKKFTINDGALPTAVTLFSVDSTNGNTIIGDPNTTSSNGNLNVYGNLTLSGGTPTGSTECEKLTLTDKYDTTFQVNTCTGDTIIGNQVARIELVPVLLNNNGTTSALPSISTILTNYQNSTDTLIYAYSDEPTTINAGGPLTTVSAAITIASNSFVPFTYYLPLQSTSGFANGDLILVGDVASGIFEIMQLVSTNAFSTPGKVIVYRAREGTIDLSTISITAIGFTVRKIVKHPESAKLIDIAQRSRTATTASPTTPFLSAILDLGYIVQQKIDYKQYVRLVRGNSSSIFVVPQTNGTIESGRLLGTRHLPGMDENRTNGESPFRRGNLTLNNDFMMIGGSLNILDSTNRSSLFRVLNDGGHAEHQGQLSWNATTKARGDFFLYGTSCPESILTEGTAGFAPTFSVDNLGNVQALLTLRVIGVAAAVPSTGISSLSVDNLGISGVNKFAIKQTGEIDSFGYEKFYTSSGARHTRFISTNSVDGDKILKPNIVYMVNVSSQDTLILTLPTVAATGDTVRVIEVGGALSYQTTLVIRAPGTGVKVQGDATGTLFGGRSTAYPSGELVVQTPNAAFTLIYLGSSDSNGQVGITATVQGWWLMEV